MKREDFPVRINGLSLLMMLILLCLCVFGMLSLSTAGAQLALAQKNAAHTAASARCEADADRLLARTYDAAAAAGSPQELAAALTQLGFTVTADGAGLTAAAETASQDGMHAALTVSVGADGAVTVTRYALLPDALGDYSSGPSLYTG